MIQSSFSRLIMVLILLGLALLGTSSRCLADPSLAGYHDPGSGPWEVVADEDLIEVCGLDPDILATVDAAIAYPYAIVRYGLLCHEHYPSETSGPDVVSETYSATKTLSAAVVGRAVTLSADLEYPLTEADRMDEWVGGITFNPDALVAHVLAMVGHSPDLSYGARMYDYDYGGGVQINRLGDVVEAVIAQDPPHFGDVSTMGEFAQKQLFDPLGMSNSFWAGEILAYTWYASLRDMARLGLLLVHDGVWDGARLVDEAWVYKMTHPVFEDANTAYGYLTWLAASANYWLPGIDFSFPFPLGTCEPPAVWSEYPHTFSESPDCGYGGLYPCEQTFDVGVSGALGLGGQLIVVHPGLDLVIVSKDAGGTAFLSTTWDQIRGALIEHDPLYVGDSTAFCSAYSSGNYAPDLITVPEPRGPLLALSVIALLSWLRRR
jgi:hypothetical protein